MIDGDSLACSQREIERGGKEPVDEQYSGYQVITQSFVSKEYGTVEDQNQDRKLAAKPRHVADHHELVSVLD